MSKALALIAKRIGGKLLPDNAQYMNRIHIPSSAAPRFYTVAQNKKTKVWGCSCPGWIIKKSNKPRTCRHLKAMLPLLLELMPKHKHLGLGH